MALAKVSEMLQMAQKANTSVIAFNCSDYNMIYSAAEVAEELKKPVICMMDVNHVQRYNWQQPKLFIEAVKLAAKGKSVPVGMHMDHCSDFDYIKAAIDEGMLSVMYDGSMLPFEENVKNTKAVAEYAHKKGADVEAELGHVGFAANGVDQKDLDLYTQPGVAAEFCERSSCDSIAIAIGSAHGFYKETPKLDLDRLLQIDQATSTPLVLHGGSGIPDDQLDIAFTRGINKFNVGTEYFWTYFQTLKKFYSVEQEDYFEQPKAVQEALMSYLRKKMLLCKMTV